jgi:hypothetical protein
MCKRAFYQNCALFRTFISFEFLITLEKKCKNTYLYKININLFISILHKAHSVTVEFLVIIFKLNHEPIPGWNP